MATKIAARTAKKSKASKKLPVCTAKDLRKKKSKRRKCTVPVKKSTLATRPSPAGAVAAPPATAPAATAFPTPFPSAPVTETYAPAVAVQTDSPTDHSATDASAGPVTATAPAAAAGLSTYAGPFGPAQAQRLLFRAGFGPTPGQAEAFAALGVKAAVTRLLNPGTVQFSGPAPTGSYLVGGQFAPLDKWGHTHLEWLDRMVRSNDSLSERMALVLHDWFGVNEESIERKLMHDHIGLLRGNWRGSFRALLKAVTVDPAMLIFLNGTTNNKWFPNENYARELMELFSLGPDRGAYTETDVRDLARCLTGWRNDWSDELRFYNFRLEPTYFDSKAKTLFAGTAAQRSGYFGVTEALNAIVDHPMHASFVVLKLWSYFIPTKPSPETQAGLEALYRSSGERLDALVEAILLHPDLYLGASLAKPPVVFAAGLLRGRRQGITTDAWVGRLNNAGQFLGRPPSVSGWNDRAWLNTATFSARWNIVNSVLSVATVPAATYEGKTETTEQAVTSALAAWGTPIISDDHRGILTRIASKVWTGPVAGDPYRFSQNFLAHRQNILRQLVAAAPDFQVS